MNDEQNASQDRRGSKRRTDEREAHLLFVASVIKDAEQATAPSTFIGYTRDISETGLSLRVSSLGITTSSPCPEGSELGVRLSLPSGIVAMKTIVARREWINAADPSEGFLVGARILELAEPDQSRYLEYLAKLD